MSGTELNETDKALVAQDNAEKADLTKGTDTHVPTGDETSPPPKVDQFAARKALFSKSSDVRKRRMAAEAEQHGDVQSMQDAIGEEADAGGGNNELDRGSHFRKQMGDEASGGQSEKPSEKRVDTRPERVKVKVLGEEYEVPRGDVDEAGGIVAYQKDRAASIRLQQAAKREAELKRREAELNQRATAAPAQSSTSTREGDATSVEAKATALVDDLYSGDPKRAREAIAEVIRASSQPAAVLDPAEIARNAAQLLRQQDSKPQTTGGSADPGLAIEIDELNSMMAEQYSDIVNDPDLKKRALDKFNALRADPDNKHRRMVDLGREAARSVQPHPRQQVVDRKRELPTPPSSTYGAPREQAETAKTPGNWIAEMRKARGLPV